jgi:hypothetical protein
MPTHQVNLDALIRREDFESGDAISGPGEPTFKQKSLSAPVFILTCCVNPIFSAKHGIGHQL